MEFAILDVIIHDFQDMKHLKVNYSGDSDFYPTPK